jgi:hypothetical protein
MFTGQDVASWLSVTRPHRALRLAGCGAMGGG